MFIDVYDVKFFLYFFVIGLEIGNLRFRLMGFNCLGVFF